MSGADAIGSDAVKVPPDEVDLDEGRLAASRPFAGKPAWGARAAKKDIDAGRLPAPRKAPRWAGKGVAADPDDPDASRLSTSRWARTRAGAPITAHDPEDPDAGRLSSGRAAFTASVEVDGDTAVDLDEGRIPKKGGRGFGGRSLARAASPAPGEAGLGGSGGAPAPVTSAGGEAGPAPVHVPLPPALAAGKGPLRFESLREAALAGPADPDALNFDALRAEATPRRRGRKVELTPLQRALQFLSRREHSRKELTAKLEARGVPAVDAAAAVGKLVDAGWQDDNRFSEMLVRNRANAGYGPAYVRAELKTQHGFGSEAIAAALATYEGDWTENARDLLRRRSAGVAPETHEQRRKAADLLYRRGFDAATARQASRFDPED